MSGTHRLTALTWRDHAHNREVCLDAAALFLLIGAQPCTTALPDAGVELDDKGFVITGDGYATSVSGLFAVGDVRAGSVKRVASAVGERRRHRRRPLLPRRTREDLTPRRSGRGAGRVRSRITSRSTHRP